MFWCETALHLVTACAASTEWRSVIVYMSYPVALWIHVSIKICVINFYKSNKERTVLCIE